MASLGGNIMPPDISPKFLFAGIAASVLIVAAVATRRASSSASGSNSHDNNEKNDQNPGLIRSVVVFCYSCFIQPHKDGESGNQQGALESFYSNQAGVYDVTRKTLLKGREDMLGLVAAQLEYKSKQDGRRKRVWVDVCAYGHSDVRGIVQTDQRFAGWRRYRLQH
jgi:betaine lipid synthase